MNVNFNDKTQSQAYDPTLWNAQDANEVKNAINSKVDAVDGKGLSTNDYTTTEKNKVASLTNGGGGSAETTNTIKQKLGTASELTDGYLTANDFTTFKGKADKSALTSKADLVNGIIPLAQLPDANLNAEQFEVLYDGSIGIKTSYLLSLGLTQGGTTPTEPSNTTPAPPTLTADDTANTISATHTLGTSEILVSVNGGAFTTYSGVINVGDVTRAAGYYRFKIKSASGRNESAIVNSPAFTQTPVGNTTPAAPTNGVVDDNSNTFGFTLVSGITLSGNYEYTLNGGTTVAGVTANPIIVGDVSKAIGQVGVRVKAASGRNASAWLFNAVAFTPTPLPSLTILSAPLTTDALTYDTATGTTTITGDQGSHSAKFKEYIPIGQNGFIQCKSFGIGLALKNSKQGGLQNPPSVTISHNKTNGKIEAFTGLNGVYQDVALNIYNDVFLRITFQTGMILFQYSNDGVTWLGNTTAVREEGVPFYAKVNAYGLKAGDYHTGLSHQGFSIDDTLTL